MNAAAPLILSVAGLALAACGSLRGDYDLPVGDANYDALNAATAACEAKGGVVRLKSGYDSRELSNYRCHIEEMRR
ncbi:MAG: hypothetical protein ACRED9_12700 [Caulobacteraceae bacterium]